MTCNTSTPPIETFADQIQWPRLISIQKTQRLFTMQTTQHTRFVNHLKARTRTMHSAQQLQGHVPSQPKPASLLNITRYLVEQRDIHAVFSRQFPIQIPVNFVDALETDIRALEMDAFQVEMPPLLQDPYVSDYAVYLETLPVHRLACHFYNLVFAHLVGGNRRVAEAAFPPAWIASSAFYQLPSNVPPQDLDTLRGCLEAEARSWTRADRRACADETAAAFAKASRLNALLLA